MIFPTSFPNPSFTALHPGLSRTSRLNKSTFWATCAQHCQSTSLFFKPWLAEFETVDCRFLACQASSTLLSTYYMNHRFYVLAPGGSKQLSPFAGILSHMRPFFKPWVRLLTFSATPKVETVETTHLNLDSSITLTSGTHVQQRFMKLPQLSRLSETLATAADTVVAGAFWSHAQLLQIPKESKSSWPKALQSTSLGQIALPILSKPQDSGLGFGWSLLKHLKT